MSYDVNAQHCSSAKCKEDISPYNKSIRADLSEILWPSYVSLVTFRPVLLLDDLMTFSRSDVMLRHKRNVHMKEKYIDPLPPVVK